MRLVRLFQLCKIQVPVVWRCMLEVADTPAPNFLVMNGVHNYTDWNFALNQLYDSWDFDSVRSYEISY